MNTKEKIFEKVNEIDDPQLLDDILEFLSSLEKADDKFYKKELVAVSEAYKEYEKGEKLLLTEEAAEEFNKWMPRW